MKKYVFWNVLNLHRNVAFSEDLSAYAGGDTFWQALLNLMETSSGLKPSASFEESSLDSRLKMYQETGINKVEIFVDRDSNRFGVRCSNSRSFFKTDTEEEALRAYVESRASTSKINTGECGT